MKKNKRLLSIFLILAMTLSGMVPGAGFYIANASTNYIVPGSASELANHLLSDAGISIVGTPTVKGVLSATSMFTDLKLAPNSEDYSLPDGVLLTTGDGTPPTSNTKSDFSVATNSGRDTDVEYYAGVSNSQDAFSLQFDFTVPNGIPAVEFIFMFGSDEYPEYLNDVVDGAAVIVDGVNYAKFANGTPLKVVSEASIEPNNGLAIEYDGMSKPQKITALLDTNRTTHSVKIVIADTSDTAYDTGLFLSAMKTSLSTNGGISEDITSAPTGLTTNLDGNSITLSTATAGGTVVGDGGSAITERGIIYSTSPNPMLGGSGVIKVADAENTIGDYSLNLTGLTPGTTYYVKAFASNAVGTTYGNEIQFATKSSSITAQSNETLTENSLGNAEITLTLKDNDFAEELDKDKFILNSAPQGVSIKSIVRNDDTHAVLTLDYNGTDFDSNIDSFSITVDGSQLAEGGNLATNSLNITAVVETSPVGVATSISETSVHVTTAVVGGTVAGDGGEAIIERGIIYSTEANPEIGKAGVIKVADAESTVGYLDLELTGLIPVTKYYVMAYATNSLGTTYGNEIEFTTENSSVAAKTETPLSENNLIDVAITLTLTDNTFVDELDKNKFTLNSAPEGVSIKSIVRKDDTHAVLTLDYNGTDFDSNIDSLSITIYASQLAVGGALTTGSLTITAVIETSPVGVSTSVSETSVKVITAVVGGTVAGDGGEAIIERGILYSTEANPEIGKAGSIKVLDNENSIGSFNLNISGLIPVTKYYVRAYAVNSLGTTYGNEVEFTTENSTVAAKSEAPLNENNLVNAEITLALTDNTFAEQLDKNKFTLNSAPEGVSIKSIVRKDDTHAVLTLDYDGTDFDSNIDNFSITVEASQLAVGGALSTGSLTITAIKETTPTGVSTSVSETSVKVTTAAVVGTVAGDGGEAIIERGIVYSIEASPEIGKAGVIKVADAESTVGYFDLELTGLIPLTKYYVRAYATNSLGTTYGNEVEFTTENSTVAAKSEAPLNENNLVNAAITLTLTDNTFVDELDKSKFTLNSAPEGVSIKSIVRKDDTHAVLTLDYNGTDFDSNIDSFSITIYASQLAVGGALTSGSLTITAVIETSPAGVSTSVSETSVKVTTAVVGGTVAGDGGEAIIERGIIYSTEANPEIGKAGVIKAIDTESSFGYFDLELTGLIPLTKYYVRAYATNSLGTTYGNEVEFTTENSTVAAKSETSLNENSLVNAAITLTLTDNIFVEQLDKNKFTLNSAPQGVSIKSIVRKDSTHAVLTLDYDGTDFDSSIDNFSITIEASQLAVGGALTTGSLTVTAIKETSPTGVSTSVSETSVKVTTAVVGGTVAGDGGEAIIERGILYSTETNPEISKAGAIKVSDKETSIGSFNLNISGLIPLTKYYVRAYATNSLGTTYGNVLEFTTENSSVAAKSEAPLNENNLVNAEVTLTLTDNTFAEQLDKNKFTLNSAPEGVSIKSIVRKDDTHVVLTLDYNGSDFDSNINNFSITVEASQLAVGGALTTGSLTVTAIKETSPTGVSTSVSETSVKVITAVVGGTVAGDGGEAITERGIVYSTEAAPEIGKAGAIKVVDTESTVGYFDLEFTGLTPLTKYYVRAYAVNSLGTTYGNELEFTTENSSVAAKCEAQLNENNLVNAEITLTLTDNTFAEQLDKNKFTLNSAPEGVSIKNIVRKDGTHAVLILDYNGTDFDSNVDNFSITVDASQLAVGGALTTGSLTVTAVKETTPVGVSTVNPVTEITASSAKFSGVVAGDGGEVITERGFVYSTKPNPVLGNEGTIKVVKTGSEIGSYLLDITGLISSLTYYVRAFASNSLGAAYGEEVSFKTLVYIPSTPQPVVEKITVDVENGNTGTVVSTTTINRTTEPNGTKKDTVNYTPESAQASVKKVLETGNDTARIVIPDAKDEVSELNVNIPKDTLDIVAKGNINLEIDTDNARISIPSKSLSGINDDLFFRVVPIKEEDKRKEVEDRAKTEQIVREVAKDNSVYVVGRPATIETNMTSRVVDITLPLRDVVLPTDPTEREDFLSKLVVFIEHSDGDKVLAKGEIVKYKDGLLGIKFRIQKFSTFTILNMENWKEYFDSLKSERISGKDRYETAVAISKKGWSKADTVVIARGDDYADALTGVPYAYQLDAPILLTNKTVISDSVKAEILRLGAKNIIILGGTGAVSETVKKTLEGLGLKVERIGGRDRYETAALIAAKLKASGRTKAVLVSGQNFADALAVSSYAAINGHPILLTTKDTLPEATKKSISSLGISSIIIAGGEGRISNAIAAKLPVEKRLAGKDRYATSLEIAKHFNIETNQIAVATGDDFADAITGSVLAAKQKNTMLMVKGNEGISPYISSTLQDYINSINPQKVTIFGGVGAVNNKVMEAIKSLIK
jgi:putative cell wall-binding protein